MLRLRNLCLSYTFLHAIWISNIFLLVCQPSDAFLVQEFSTTKRFRASFSSRTILNVHRFNGGYDPSSPLTWTPQQAAEFTIFHEGTPEHAGMQLKTTIQHWRGEDLAEFLTRLYLGQERHVQPQSGSNYHNNHQKVLVYEPQNVRSPQWRGLESREGVLALHSLLFEALSADSLGAREVARFAEAFLLKEYKWPSDQWDAGTVVFEQDSFYSRGYGKTLARVLWSVRAHRMRAGSNRDGGSAPAYTSEDIVDMVTLPEKENKESTSLELKDFFQTLVARIPLTDADKASMVQRLAIGGWGPASIPQFMASILENHDQEAAFAATEYVDYYLDFPSKLNVLEYEMQQDKWQEDHNSDDQGHYAGADEQVILAYSRNENQRAEDMVRLEYDQLVQAYWKKVEIPQRSSSEEDTDRDLVSRTRAATQPSNLY